MSGIGKISSTPVNSPSAESDDLPTMVTKRRKQPLAVASEEEEDDFPLSQNSSVLIKTPAPRPPQSKRTKLATAFVSLEATEATEGQSTEEDDPPRTKRNPPVVKTPARPRPATPVRPPTPRPPPLGSRTRTHEITGATPMSPVKLVKPGCTLKLFPPPIVAYEVNNRMNRFMFLSSFNNLTTLHLRDFKEDRQGARFPTKAGVRLTAGNVRRLLHFLKEIRENCSNMSGNRRFHLGGHLYLFTDHDFGTKLVLHQWYYDEDLDLLNPTKKRVAVTPRQLEIFIEGVRQIEDAAVWDELTAMQVPCIITHMEENQDSLASCTFCTPQGCFLD
jgi:hypothetical protein